MGRIETSGGNLGVQEAWFGFLMCAAPEVWQCLYPTGDSGFLTLSLGP